MVLYVRNIWFLYFCDCVDVGNNVDEHINVSDIRICYDADLTSKHARKIEGVERQEIHLFS